MGKIYRWGFIEFVLRGEMKHWTKQLRENFMFEFFEMMFLDLHCTKDVLHVKEFYIIILKRGSDAG